MKPSQLSEILKVAITNKLTLLIKGAPGIGKTDIVKMICNLIAARLIMTHPVVSDPTDIKGLPFIVTQVDGKQVAEFLPIGHMRLLIDADELTVVFFDDLGQAPPSVQAAVMQLLLERRINGHKVSDNVVFVAATNDRSHKAHVQACSNPSKAASPASLN